MKKVILFLVSTAFALTFFANAQAADDDTLRVAMHDTDSLDAYGVNNHSNQNVVNANIMDRLLDVDENGKFIPLLALSATSEDNKVWDVRLRKGVRFHDGTDFNAHDVKYSFERYPKVATSKGYLDDIEKVEVVDTHIARFTLVKPEAMFVVSYLATPVMPMMSDSQKDMETKDIAVNPIGTGPYKFVSWRKGSQIVLERNEDYWGQRPNVKRIVFKIMPEAAAQLLALKAGDVDLALNPVESGAAKLREDSDFKLFTPPAFRCWYVYMNTKSGPMQDLRVRQALNYAVDKELLIEAIVYGFGREMGSFMPPGALGYKMTNPYTYDPEKAKKLLAEAGYPNGFSTNLYNASHYNPKLAQAIQGFWRAVGVNAKIITMENAAWTSYRKKPLTETDMQTHMQYVVINYPEAYKWNWVAFSDEFVPGGPYQSVWSSMGFTSPELQEHHKTIKVTSDPKERIKMYHWFQDVTSAGAPFVALFSQTWVIAGSKRVEGFEASLGGAFFFRDVYLK